MARITRRDRLARIKAAASYPTAREAIAARLAAKTAQTAVRTPIDVPVAEPEPKHLSAAYRRAAIRRAPVSQWLEKYRQYLSYIVAERCIPERVAKINPVYAPPVVVSPSDGHRNLGIVAPAPAAATHARITAHAITYTSEQLRRAETVLQSIPADTPSHDLRAERDAAQYLIDVDKRKAEGAAISARTLAIRADSHRIDVENTAKNARQFALDAKIPQRLVYVNSAEYFGAALYASRCKLSSLVPLATR